MLDGVVSFIAALPFWGIVLLGLAPVAGLVGLVISLRFLARRRRLPAPVRVERSSVGRPLDELRQLVQAYYRSQGYDTVTSGEPDQPADTLALKAAHTILVRCQPGKTPADAEAVTELARARDRLRAERAVLIAPGGFLAAARRRAVALGVEVRDNTQIDLMRAILDRRAGETSPNAH
ncbi:MAG: restriction endonuclease [Anaerolineales bacterium]|nr:restriction endonuclease [Anaerolineales bacterium]